MKIKVRKQENLSGNNNPLSNPLERIKRKFVNDLKLNRYYPENFRGSKDG